MLFPYLSFPFSKLLILSDNEQISSDDDDCGAFELEVRNRIQAFIHTAEKEAYTSVLRAFAYQSQRFNKVSYLIINNNMYLI